MSTFSHGSFLTLLEAEGKQKTSLCKQWLHWPPPSHALLTPRGPTECSDRRDPSRLAPPTQPARPSAGSWAHALSLRSAPLALGPCLPNQRQRLQHTGGGRSGAALPQRHGRQPGVWILLLRL